MGLLFRSQYWRLLSLEGRGFDLRPSLIWVVITVGLLAGGCRYGASRPPSISSVIPHYITPTYQLTVPAVHHGGIRGRLIYQGLSSNGMFVYLARITWDKDRNIGVYVFDHSFSPWAVVRSDGYFYVEAEPGDYVMFFGRSPEDAIPLRESDGKAMIIKINQGEIIDIGELKWP